MTLNMTAPPKKTQENPVSIGPTGVSTTTNINDFAKKTSGRVLPPVRLKRVHKASENEYTAAKILLFGDWNTGKTFFLVGLLESGHKILCISTDTGGDGLLTIKLHFRKIGKPQLLDNLYYINLEDADEVQNFLDSPKSFMPDIYESGISILVWEGYSGYQQLFVSERVGQYAADKQTGGKAISEVRQDGYQLEQNDWGIVRNMTMKSIHDFCALKNEVTGIPFHKIVTCQEGFRLEKKGDKSELVESRLPLLQGAGGKLMGAAFDLIIRTDKEYKDNKPEYLYKIDQQNLTSKNRGFPLLPIEPGDPKVLWGKIMTALGHENEIFTENL